MTSQNAFGLFKYVPGLSHGDPYAKAEKAKALAKTQGKQFTIKGPKTGKTVDVYFDPTVASSVYVGSKYTTLNETFSKAPEGKGSYFGTFGRWQNMKTSSEFDKREKGSALKTLSPRNIYTSPSKSGHPGLLGCRKGPTGVVNEYKYEMSPPPPRPTRESVAPFKPSSPARRGLFSQDCHVTFTPMSYANEGPPVRQTRSSDGTKPFRPANVSQVILNKGPLGRIYGTVNRFPEYQPQGPLETLKTKSDDSGKLVGPVFRPPSTPKSMRSYSIANMPRNLLVAF